MLRLSDSSGLSLNSDFPIYPFKTQRMSQNRGQRECQRWSMRKSAVKYCLLDTPRKALMNSHIGKDPCKSTKGSVSTAADSTTQTP